MMGYRYNMMGYGRGWFMMVCSVILTAVAIVALFSFIKYFTKKNNSIDYSNKALNILNERFAKGEISEDEYNHKKSQLLR